MSDEASRLVLRSGAPPDVDTCVALWAAACARRDGRAGPGVAERARLKFARESGWIVAERPGGTLAGFALATAPGSGIETDPSAAVVLGLLAVDPAEQGGGLGRRLLARITSLLAENGFEQVVLHALVDNLAAIRLYETAGWSPLGAHHMHSFLKRPMQTYQRPLGPAAAPE